MSDARDKMYKVEIQLGYNHQEYSAENRANNTEDISIFITDDPSDAIKQFLDDNLIDAIEIDEVYAYEIKIEAYEKR